ncbi:MAG: hypothetical protein RLZZ507_1974 [Cyanobacteriota bacterium]|jgi:nucleoside-diphosphate-sugar epimerase
MRATEIDQEKNMKKCLITGVSGLIGSHLVSELSQNWHITGLSRSKRICDLQSTEFEHLALDLSKKLDTSLLPEKIDAVIHLAQSENFREFPKLADDIFQVNTVSTLVLLDYARRAGARTFILASSGGIYGYGEQDFSEDVEISANGDLGFYLGTKLCSEVLANSYIPFFNIIVLRFFFVYGHSQRRSMLIPRLVESVLERKPITLQGENGIRINPTYVSDAVAAISRSLELDGSHKINVAGANVLSLREIGEIIGKVVERKPKFDLQLDANPRHLVGDISRMSKILGSPKVNFADGIKIYINKTYGIV